MFSNSYDRTETHSLAITVYYAESMKGVVWLINKVSHRVPTMCHMLSERDCSGEPAALEVTPGVNGYFGAVGGQTDARWFLTLISGCGNWKAFLLQW